MKDLLVIVPLAVTRAELLAIQFGEQCKEVLQFLLVDAQGITVADSE